MSKKKSIVLLVLIVLVIVVLTLMTFVSFALRAASRISIPSSARWSSSRISAKAIPTPMK